MIATSTESVAVPSLGLYLPAGVGVEVTPDQAQALADHPRITLSPDTTAPPAQVPPASELPSTSVAQVPDPETTPTPQEVNNG